MAFHRPKNYVRNQETHQTLSPAMYRLGKNGADLSSVIPVGNCSRPNPLGRSLKNGAKMCLSIKMFKFLLTSTFSRIKKSQKCNKMKNKTSVSNLIHLASKMRVELKRISRG